MSHKVFLCGVVDFGDSAVCEFHGRHNSDWADRRNWKDGYTLEPFDDVIIGSGHAAYGFGPIQCLNTLTVCVGASVGLSE